jgi:hypothetical protein
MTLKIIKILLKIMIKFSRIKQDKTEISLDAGASGLLVAVHAVQSIVKFLSELKGPICGVHFV